MNIKPFLRIGCVADDFTGAGDIASFIAQRQARVLLINGVPDERQEIDGSYDAVVIALKSRTAAPREAARETRLAFDYLRAHGARQLYFKYCSTFDSTPQGNIGPVLDHLLESYGIPYTILCPALPVNHRVVRDGRLYVDGVPLDESPMRYHPLNPMWDSRVCALMESQSRYRCYELTHEAYRHSDEEIMERVGVWARENEHFYIAVDFFKEEHGERIAKLFGSLPLLTGGSALPPFLLGGREGSPALRPGGAADSRAILLAGSCSEMTLRQIDRFVEQGGAAQRIVPAALLAGEQTEQTLWRFAEAHPREDVLFYSSQTHEEIALMARYSQREISDALETLMAALGKRAIDEGVTRLIVAGGETSGAVMGALKESAYEIGPAVAPGVPILIPSGKKDVRLVLKSGNFGKEDFFIQALRALGRGEAG